MVGDKVDAWLLIGMEKKAAECYEERVNWVGFAIQIGYDCLCLIELDWLNQEQLRGVDVQVQSF